MTCVRKSGWAIALYDAAVSLSLGAALALFMSVFILGSLSSASSPRPLAIAPVLKFSIGVMAVVALVCFTIQLIAGPFVLTRDVVCRTCHTRRRADRIPFFRGRFQGPTRCPCGGEFEPAVLWRP
jgi:hypothetical protein